jgi:UPF0176 protein
MSSSASPTTLIHSAFYRFTPLQEPQQFAAWLREQCALLLGFILVAPEGVSGAVAGELEAVAAFEQALALQPGFTGIAFKHSACSSKPFSRMKVQVKPELVQTGLAGLQAEPDVSNRLSPAQWREAIARDDVVVIDNRNSFEFRLGRFKGALDPQVKNFRDFPAFIQSHAGAWKAQGKRVAMYCTGGIRCEKTSSWVRSFGLEVVELEGGILNYFASVPDAARDFEGECFVFDNRIAINTQLEETNTTLDEVYEAEPDGQWRIARARRLDPTHKP